MEEHRPKVFENRVLRQILGLKRDEVVGEWRKLHSDRLDALYTLPNIIWVIKLRRIIWAGHVARMVNKRGAWCVFMGNLMERGHLGDPGVDGRPLLKRDLKQLRWGGMDWIDLAQDMDRLRALVDALINLRIPYNAGNFLTSWGPVSLSGRTRLHSVS